MALADAVSELSEPYLIGVVLALLLFTGWVIMSEHRTRHLTQLIRAIRGPWRRGRDQK